MNMLSLTSDLSALLKKKSKSEHTSTTLIDVNADECYKKDQKAKIINKCKVHVLNNGYCFLIATNRKIFHRVNEKISRPIRGSQRRAIMDKFKAGGSVYPGKSKKVFKKIKAETNAESLLSPDISLGILQLHDKLAQEMNSDGIIKEYVLSWNATGGIAKNSSSKQCLYYELTITHPNIVDEDSLVPLTFRLSESQTLFTVKQWLLSFKECYRKDMRKRVNKYLSEDAREIAMWAIALLVNTSTWSEIKENWRLIYQIIDEEEELNKADSPFKQELQAIYKECLTTCIKNNGAFSSSDKASKGTRQWLSYINQQCISTIPIWPNILLGNLSRHGTSTVRAFDNLLLSSHNQRTNAISERRMSIVKRTQLRSDVILEILVNDMKKMVEKCSISLMAIVFQDTDNETNSQQLKIVQERWRQSSRRGHGRYAKTPETSIMNNLKSSLIIYSSNINDALLIPHLSIAYWLNISIELLLLIKFVRETYRPALMTTPLLIDILSFINN
ncbi:unnamed protein product [Rotaria magnacalcarata]|uniref:Uncharacterized protein n=1 Tax=Rotaria magnacalcarata TaxID=392030 RepID=A0A816Q1Y5_9BILA|nr:unnamed protein product [Rotaria magnacalcarata]